MKDIEKKFKGDQRFKAYVKLILENPDTTEYNLPIVFSCEGLDVDRLELAINKIVQRHANLRSSFVIENDILFQIVHKYTPITITRLRESFCSNFAIPFDLSKGPSFRISVFENTVYADFSHFFVDGVSLGIFFHELNEFYKGNEIKSKGEDVENLIVSDEVYKINGEFYKQFFPKNLKKTFLKYDFNDKSIPEFGPCVTEYRYIDSDFMKKIKETSRLACVTPFNFTTAAFHILISMITKDSTVYSNTNVCSRNSKNFRAIGLFTTAVYLRYTINPEKTVREFLAEIFLYHKEVLKHQNVNMRKLITELGIDYKEVSEFSFLYQNEMISNIKLDDKVCKITPISYTDSQKNIFLSFFARKDTSAIQLCYRTDCYKKETILRFIDDYIKVLKIMINNPDILISDIFKLMNY